jgi:hypothetical protein
MGFSDWFGRSTVVKDRSEIDRLEALAEAAYGRLFEAKDRLEAKACWEAASQHFSQAIEAAKRLASRSDVERLTARKCHCYGVWFSRFRTM